MARADAVLAAKALVATLPALIDQAVVAGKPLANAVNGMRIALDEAHHVVDLAHRRKAITSAGELMRRMGG